MQLSDLIKIYPNVASPDWCAEVVELSTAYQFDHYKTDGYEFYQLSASQTPSFKPYASQFLDAFCDIAEEYFTELDLLPMINHTGFNLTEDVRVKKYKANSDMGFKEHVDVVDMDSASRYLTGILYLNDNDGDTVFRDLSVRPTVGTMVIFPPMWMFPHIAKTPTNANKYIMMSSLRY